MFAAFALQPRMEGHEDPRIVTRRHLWYDNSMRSSYKRAARRTKAVTVRVPPDRLKKVMRARNAVTQSKLINDLLTEEEERLEAEGALRATAGAAGPDDFDDRLL